jgi:hypothetical protein
MGRRVLATCGSTVANRPSFVDHNQDRYGESQNDDPPWSRAQDFGGEFDGENSIEPKPRIKHANATPAEWRSIVACHRSSSRLQGVYNGETYGAIGM